MAGHCIKAITFDLWDTVINDDSDEPKRAALGLRPKRDQRPYAVFKALDQGDPISQEDISLAYEAVNDEFNRVWHDEYLTWTVSERIGHILDKLDRTLSPRDFSDLVAILEDMELEVPPDPIEGVGAALEELSKAYPLAVVSDTIFSPGRNLRKWLDLHGLLQYFSGFAFSDEVGRSKPDPAIFASAATQLGVELNEMVHIGDREHNDIKGAHALGMRAILFTATRDTDAKNTTADAVCPSYLELPGILNRLDTQ
ncbi:MAG: HAD family hydrolase [Acidiferrobacterales bacterium]|nr:HAD family hydrolase [Acidiferrobacterales bacterium]